MTFTRVKGLKPRVDVFTKKLHHNMTRLWVDATKAFVAESVKHIHVDTGMSRMSMAPLGRAVRMLTVVRDLSTSPGKHGHKPRKGLTNLDGTYDPEGWRSAALGEQLGEKPTFRLNFGSTARPVFLFEFDIKVYQYALHEDNWESLSKGREAFLNYLKHNAINYVPKLAEWIFPEGH